MTNTEREGLQRILLRRRWVWHAWLAFLPGGALVSAIVIAAGGGEAQLEIGAAIFLVAWGFVIVRAGFARCPRCRRFFNEGRRGGWNPYRQSCGHCGLPLP